MWFFLFFLIFLSIVGKPPDIAKQRVNFTSFNLSLFVCLLTCLVEYRLCTWSILVVMSYTLACNTKFHDAGRKQRQAQCRTCNEVQEKCWYNNQVSWFLKNLFVLSQAEGEYYNFRRMFVIIIQRERGSHSVEKWERRKKLFLLNKKMSCIFVWFMQ